MYFPSILSTENTFQGQLQFLPLKEPLVTYLLPFFLAQRSIRGQKAVMRSHDLLCFQPPRPLIFPRFARIQ